MAQGVQTTFSMDTSGAQREARAMLGKLAESEAALKSMTEQAARMERKLVDAHQRGTAGAKGLANSIYGAVAGYLSFNQVLSVVNGALATFNRLQKESVEASLAAAVGLRQAAAAGLPQAERQRGLTLAAQVGVAPDRAAALLADAVRKGLSVDEFAAALAAAEKTGQDPLALFGGIEKKRDAFGAGPIRGEVSAFLNANLREGTELLGAFQGAAAAAKSIGASFEETLATVAVGGESEIKDPARVAKAFSSLIELIAQDTVKVGKRERAITGTGIVARTESLLASGAELEGNARILAEIITRDAELIRKRAGEIAGELVNQTTLKGIESAVLADPVLRESLRVNQQRAENKLELLGPNALAFEREKETLRGKIRRGERAPYLLGLPIPALQEFALDTDIFTPAYAQFKDWRAANAASHAAYRQQYPFEVYGDPGGGLGGLGFTEMRDDYIRPPGSNEMAEAARAQVRAARMIENTARSLYRFLPPAPMLASPSGRGNQ